MPVIWGFQMGNISLVGLGLISILIFIGPCSSQGMSDSKYYDWMGVPIISGGQGTVTYPDWLNPFTAGRPDWDPYGPGSIFYPAADRAAWDPYAPVYGRSILNMEPADPAAEGLTVQGSLRTPNQLYLQRDGFLVTDGRVILGEPYVLWAFVGYQGNFVLYDNDEMALSQSYVRPGWYRITGLYPEILWSHRYRFTSAGLSSNVLQVFVESGGYPTNYGLTGRVVDVSGRGMPGVGIRISGSDGGTFTTATNAQGYYGFDAPSGTYAIAASLPGYSFTPSTARVWTGTISVAQKIIGYAAGAKSISGVQSSVGTQSTAGVQSNAGTSGTTGTGTQSAAGTQGIRGTGPYGYDSWAYGGYLGPGGSTGWVSGKITDQTGAAIPQAVIRADGLMTATASDAQGNYRIALNPGMHRIDAEKTGYSVLMRSVIVVSAETVNLDLTAKRTATVGSGP